MKKKSLFAMALITANILGSMTSYAAAGRWVKDNVGWWYSLNAGGYCRNEWMKDDDGSYYYFNDGGYMVANQWIGDYYLGSSGAMLTNAITPDGYRVASTGKWLPDHYAGRSLSGEVLLITDIQGSHASVSGNRWNIAGDWMVRSENSNYMFSNQQLTVSDSTRFYGVREGGGAEVAISRAEFERRLSDKSLGYTSFRMELRNNNVVSAYVYD